jgi:thiamine transport system substrate-binding protein
MKRIPLLSFLAALLTAACATPVTEALPTATPSGPRTLTVMTHDSFAISETVLQEFETANNVTVSLLKSGDAGTLVNTALLNTGAPLADVLYGLDNTLLSRALENDLFEAYEPAALADIPAELKLDSTHHALPVDYGDVCLNYDKAYFEQNNLAPPASLAELTLPQYKGLLVVEDPATSSPGLGFMLATWATIGPDNFAQYWADLRANDVKVVPDWETAYYSDFSGSSGRGPRPLAVSYASSPPAEVIYASEPLSDAPTASITSAGSCFRQVEFVGILKGTTSRDLAEKWVDFMLAKTFQEDMPLNMFVYPVLPSAVLPEAFIKYSGIVADPVILDPMTVGDNRDALIQQWTQIVIK